MAVSADSRRFEGFVYLRAIAILAVVYIHGCDSNATARHAMKWLGFAVPCFFIMSAFLAQRAFLHNAIPWMDFIRRKFSRLAPPFLAWSSLYLLVRYMKAAATGNPVDSELLGCIFWGDASYQLYFVPMLLYSLVAWAPMMSFANKSPTVSALLLFASACGLALVAPALDRHLPANRWFIAPNLAWFPIGMAIAIAVNTWGSKWQLLKWPSCLLLIAAISIGWSNVYYTSICVFILATTIQKSPHPLVHSLAKISFGIYLAHVLIIETMQFILPKISLPIESMAVTLLITACAAVGSVAICLPLYRHRRLRWLVA